MPICEQAKSALSERPVFTNCGNAEDQETPIKSAKRLMRVPFKVSLKELVDNALDAAEEI